MSDLSVQALIDAGAHIGCRVGRWNPKMEPYILESRNRIHIIDLRETIRGILRARHFLREIVASGQDVLFVGTKTQLRGTMSTVKEKAEMHFVEDRWIGGTLTNYEVIGSRIAYLEELEKKEQEGHLETLTKKEGARFLREKRKVFRNLHGIRHMVRLPGAMVVVDPRVEGNAVREAQRMGIPVIGIVDTDCDPDPCDLVIPANDDAIRSVGMILEHLLEGVKEGRRLRKERGVAEPTSEMPTAVGKGVPMPRPRRGGSRRPSRQQLETADRQVEIQALPEEKPAAEAAPAADAPSAPADAPAEAPAEDKPADA